MTSQFHELLKEQLPRLRVMALAMTRDRSAADDLVQDTVVNALAGQESFVPGTNFGAWTYRIMRNHFISGKRRARPMVDIDDAPAEALTVAPTHEDSVMAREVLTAIQRLPLLQREALLMASLGGLSYEDIAEHCKCSIGTAKSRVCRARQHLQAILLGVDKASVEDANRRKIGRLPLATRAEKVDFATGPLA